MEQLKWFHDELLLLPLELLNNNAEEALTKMGNLLYHAGYVKDSYTSAIIEREKIYPTGLPASIGVAVPHTDAHHVLKFGLAIGILNHPVPFIEMGSGGERSVDVQVIMALAVPDKDKVVNMLQHLFGVIQMADFLPTLITLKDHQALSKFIDERINLQSPPPDSDEQPASPESNANDDSAEITLTITHPVGLHARPASIFVKTAKGFTSNIKVSFGGREANAKSILTVLQLGAGQGATIEIQAQGNDRDKALQALKELVESNFGGVE